MFLPIVYRLSGSDSAAFSIDANGKLSSQKRFDREECDRYYLTLEATDYAGKGLTSTLSITVSIIDVNDNRPTFKEKFYSMTVSEETSSTSFTVNVCFHSRLVFRLNIV